MHWKGLNCGIVLSTWLRTLQDLGCGGEGGGDFNVILNEKEKLGGLPITHSETADFEHCLNTCNLKEIDFTGSSYT